MKFLLALSVLVSFSSFAQTGGYEHSDPIKCWESAQGRRGYPTYIFEIVRNGVTGLKVVYPRDIYLQRKHDCYVSQRVMPTDPSRNSKFEVCLGEGQHINGLVPVDVDEEYFEGTVYCEREIKRAFHRRHGGGTTGGILTGGSFGY